MCRFLRSWFHIARKEGKTEKHIIKESEYPMSPWGASQHLLFRQNEESGDERVAAEPKPVASENLPQAYIKEGGRVPLLTDGEERALAGEIQEGQGERLRRLMKLGLEMEGLHMITRKERNFSDGRIAVIMPKVEKLEVENQISSRQSVPVSEMRSLHSRLTQFKGEMFKWNLRFG